MGQHPKRFTFSTLALILAVIAAPAFSAKVDDPAKSNFGVSSGQGKAAQKEAGWRTHNDPKGFSLDTPADWSVATDPQFGRIAIQGKRGERAIIWPMFVEQQLDSRGAAALAQQFTLKADPDMNWGAPELLGSMLRVVGRSGGRNGVTLLSWFNGQGGTAVYVFSVEAPSNLYPASLDTFVRILGSFKVVKEQAASDQKGQGKSSTPEATYAFVNWTDPLENAFNVSVPQGWKAIGGAYRLAPLDVRQAVTLFSPDGQIRISINDPNIGSFLVPTPMFNQTGFREGSFLPLSDGSKVEIRSFRTGPQFAQEYVQGVSRKECADLRVLSHNDRQDLAALYGQELRAEGVPSSQVSAGDISFTCNVNGREARGYYAVATAIPFPEKGQAWYVHRMYGYFAPGGRQQEAESICQQVARSWRVNPEWRARQKQITASAVQQDNLRSQQVRNRALKAISEDLRQTSEIVSSTYWNKQPIMDEISRKRENVNLGTVDVIDPATGKQYKIDYKGDYHWMDYRDNIATTKIDSSPGYGWRQMITLP